MVSHHRVGALVETASNTAPVGERPRNDLINEAEGSVYCLVEAPNAEAAMAVHREAHGLVADDIIEVEEGY